MRTAAIPQHARTGTVAGLATKQLCKVVFPTQRVLAELTGRHFSHWARFDRWRSGQRGGIVSSPADEVYVRYFDKELKYWQNPPHGDENTVHGSDEHPGRAASLREYWNRIMTGSPYKTRSQRLAEMGPFRHALALAHCPGLEEMMASGLAERWTYNSITGRFTDLPVASDRVSVTSDDLNFIDLPENTYDLIIAEGVLHHIVNIDHLLAQVARALTPDGMFFVMEYVGEERFKWTPKKTRFLNGLLAELPLKYLRYKLASVDVMHFSQLSPFEAVTSAKLPELLGRHFVLREARTAYAVLFPALEFLKEEYLCTENPALDMLIEADGEAVTRGLLPTTLAGIYGKIDG